MRRLLLLIAVAVLVTTATAAATGGFGAAWQTLPGLASVGSPPPATPARSPEPTRPPNPEPTPTPTPVPTPAPPNPILGDRLGPDDRGVASRLQAALDVGRAAMAAPGIVASVLLPNGRQWTGVAGVADLATGRGLTPSTPFAVASVSKTFLAAEILALVEEGRLGLDDPVAPLLPETLVGGLPIDPLITVRMLLDHTSGLGDFLVSRELDRAVLAEPTATWTPEQSLAYAGKPVAPPGAGYRYANTNYVILGLLAERLTGVPLAVEYRARFFDPFGLTSASYQGVEPPVAELPRAYRYSSRKLDAVPVDVTDGSAIRPFTALTTAAGAAGSVAASAPDLARWAWALYTGRVIPTGLVRQMVDDAARTETLDPPYPYGLGVQVLTIDGRTSYGHSGRLVGARSLVRWFPAEGVAIAIVTNQSRFDPTPLLIDLLDIVAPAGVSDGRRGIEIGAPANRNPAGGTTAALALVPMGLSRAGAGRNAVPTAGGAMWIRSRRSRPMASSVAAWRARTAWPMSSRRSTRSTSTG